ncbi:hypothetical protein [Actinokineospora sp. NBRC 105648]|uniref:hypothetical protein n=1 Tax=Actinokineospora sp. NBRC 105648 TaxID=3032206 RepID=UPI002554E077|nr:hypothetical protein [Actinokineospora sp. NBRC 105648]
MTDPAAPITDPGKAFAEALAAKDPTAIRALTTPDLDFRAMTPGKFWQTSSHEDLLDVLFTSWLEPADEVLALLSTETGDISSRRHVSYRMRIRNGDGEFLMEQQMYYQLDGNKICWARVMCSGFIPV